MFDLQVLAFQTDLTRVITFMMGLLSFFLWSSIPDERQLLRPLPTTTAE